MTSATGLWPNSIFQILCCAASRTSRRLIRGCSNPVNAQHPRILLHVLAGMDAFELSQQPDSEWVTHLYGDLFFFQSPEPVYRELQGAAVAIIPHRYPARIERLRKFGTTMSGGSVSATIRRGFRLSNGGGRNVLSGAVTMSMEIALPIKAISICSRSVAKSESHRKYRGQPRAVECRQLSDWISFRSSHG